VVSFEVIMVAQKLFYPFGMSTIAAKLLLANAIGGHLNAVNSASIDKPEDGTGFLSRRFIVSGLPTIQELSRSGSNRVPRAAASPAYLFILSRPTNSNHSNIGLHSRIMPPITTYEPDRNAMARHAKHNGFMASTCD
jgi:hypothetical protein